MRSEKRQAGFSLIELMVVLMIAMIMMAIALPNFIRAYRANRLNGAISDLSNIVQRTRFEAVRLNRSIACRVLPGLPITLFVDLNGDSIRQATEPVVVLGSEFQFAIAGTPGPGSMGVGATAVPPLRLTFDGRGAPDYSNTLPGMGLAPASPTMLSTLGNASRPQDGYRALTVSPMGKLTVWRAPSGGAWSHSQ